ncbi:MAG TPA: response regulator [Candidatus Omnitrophota bacterium]|jgi:signal transduction histidine kinase/DNA-binding response OmpR family regulator|nr:response regulator [Candidatus Omnitrophota bacterium]HPN55756.1 response regulator [Candidatus Omnitrophota bacterium]
MTPERKEFLPQVPQLDLSEGTEMLTDFSREAQRHLIAARNALLILETVPSDREAVEDVFKTFHTIKGLADFLDLHDIFSLTASSETLLDKFRKNLLQLDNDMILLITRAIEALQKLLELLDEQIVNGGELKSEYLDVTSIIAAVDETIRKSSSSARPVKPIVRNIPKINFEPDMTACTLFKQQLEHAQGRVDCEVGVLSKLLQDYEETGRELKVAQSKLHERQRELIKERELAIKLTQQAQEEARAKSEYLANMSHEIRTLINAILGFTDLLKESGLNSKQNEHLNTIIVSGRMLLEIVNDILDFSKVESGKLKLEKIPFNLDYVVEEVFKIIRTRLTSKPINLYFNIALDVPRFLMGDPTRLKQIFINLIDNAIKFTEHGEIGLEVSLVGQNGFTQPGRTLKFLVRDTGIGIPEDRQDAVFETFTQANDATTRIYGGSGLGLALCKTFVETMGGTIWLESKLGEGSRFIFTICFDESTEHPPKEDVVVLQKNAGAEVLIVDMHETSLRQYLPQFEAARLNVLAVCQTAKQASELLLSREKGQQSLPALIFIDLLLPEKQAYMLAYKLKQQEHYKNIKLIGVSSDVKVETSSEFNQAGFDIFLPKPIISAELCDVLQRVLGEKTDYARVLSDEMIQKISCSGVRVLVAEDSIPNMELLKVHFETLGCTCDYAANGQEAIEFLRKNDYGICFMDLQMPVMGGVEATRIIRNELKKNLPIIALTAAELEDEKDRCLEAGMTDYLPKPFGVDELKEKIIRNTKM